MFLRLPTLWYHFSLSTSSQLTFQWVVHVIDGMDYRGQTREELSWTCLWQKVWRLKPFFPSPPFPAALCPFLSGICYYSMPTVVELGGADSTWIHGCNYISWIGLILEISPTKHLVVQAFFPLPTFYNRSPTSHFVPSSVGYATVVC